MEIHKQWPSIKDDAQDGENLKSFGEGCGSCIPTFGLELLSLLCNNHAISETNVYKLIMFFHIQVDLTHIMASVAIPDPLDMSSASPPPGPSGEKKPWSELRQAVKKSHRAASSILSCTPHSFTFHHKDLVNDRQSRLYFLGVPNGQRENTLLYVDLTKNTSADFNLLQWKPLLDSSISSQTSSLQLSKEEQLMRERKRLRSVGITAYDFSAAASKFAFAASSNLFVCEDKMPEGGFTVSKLKIIFEWLKLLPYRYFSIFCSSTYIVKTNRVKKRTLFLELYKPVHWILWTLHLNTKKIYPKKFVTISIYMNVVYLLWSKGALITIIMLLLVHISQIKI